MTDSTFAFQNASAIRTFVNDTLNTECQFPKLFTVSSIVLFGVDLWTHITIFMVLSHLQQI